MCGILLHYNPLLSEQIEGDEVIEYTEENKSVKRCCDDSIDFNMIVPYIARRGPNYSMFRVSKEDNISWFSSILSLRKPFTKQCIEISDRFILQFNGELYNDGINGMSDTEYFVNLMKNCNDEVDIIEIIRALDGEFAYTIFDSSNKKIYFGRDLIGKRSLMFKLNAESGEIYIASVTGGLEGFQNCIGGIIYRFDMHEKELKSDIVIKDSYEVTSAIDEDFQKQNQFIDLLYDALYKSVEKRVLSIEPSHIEESPIAVLYSGGLDCSVIVAIICEILKTKPNCSSNIIELLNVGFENPRTGLLPKDAPDRKLAITSADTLKNLYPEIDIKLVEIDVPYEEYVKTRSYVIDLIYPKVTEMDLSIAIAFYFASKGDGFTHNIIDNKRVKYQRNGIVLFSGLGADELYGGYHKFANKSTEELISELNRQINNIHDRNLNRDDKVMADNGIEVRYPFLDDNVVQISTQSISINYKINKKILRDLANDKLRLESISNEPKRAIQFGAKSAKMTKDGNKNGTDILKPYPY